MCRKQKLKEQILSVRNVPKAALPVGCLNDRFQEILAIMIEPPTSLIYYQIMPRIHHEIPAVKIDYVCDRCEHGIYRLVSKKPTTTDYIHMWQHRCTHCGDLADFAVPYPLIEVDGGPVSRVFIQREALPAPSGPSSQAFSVQKSAD